MGKTPAPPMLFALATALVLLLLFARELQKKPRRKSAAERLGEAIGDYLRGD